jgi:hypothetical protein
LNEKYLQFTCLFKNNNAMPRKKIVHVSLTWWVLFVFFFWFINFFHHQSSRKPS